MLDYRDSKTQQLAQAILKSYRKSASMTQSDLAKKLATPQSFVSKYESGERILNISEIRIVCSVLGRSLVEFSTDIEKG